jgi:membrane protease YdiL (CAAX protease family)
MQKYRFHFVFAACCGVVVAILSWLLVSPDSPVETSSADVKNALGFINIIPFILTTILSGNIHGGSDTAYWILVLVQWFIVCFVLALLFRGLRGHSDAA